MFPDLVIALETIDLYSDKYLAKPNASMTKEQRKNACEKLFAAQMLKEHLQQHWAEAPASDLVFNFVKEWHRISKVVTNDMFATVVYQVSKEIFYYFC